MKQVIEHPVCMAFGVAFSIVGSICSIYAVITSAIGFLVVALLFFLVAAFLFVINKGTKPTLAASSIIPLADPEPANSDEKQCIDCVYCGGSGSVVSYDQFRTDYTTCGICGGHGQIRTKLWSQPPCRRCGGSGALNSTDISHTLVSGRRRSRIHRHTTHRKEPCDVCGGIGRRPILDSSD